MDKNIFNYMNYKLMSVSSAICSMTLCATGNRPNFESCSLAFMMDAAETLLLKS